MRPMKKILIITLTFSSLLMGCQGQNPFKRQSNPLKDYPNAQKANEPYVPGKRAVNAGIASGTGTALGEVKPSCFYPLIVEAEPDFGQPVLKFSEDHENSYLIRIALGGKKPDPNKIFADFPEGSSLRRIGRDNNVFIYKFSWKPDIGESAQSSKALVIGLNLTSSNGACEGAESSVSFGLAVSKSKDTPTVEFSEVKSRIKFGESFEFNIIAEDALAAKGRSPAIKSISFKNSRIENLLDASNAVISCNEGQSLDDSKFQFTCRFDSNLVNGVESFLNSGKEAEAVAQITVVSRSTGISSGAVSLRTKIHFEKIETKSTSSKGATL